eukprot:CAMPEP_0201721768 /NCGR_PEP_ID=MMETSP0593-20130828/6363_1 /ASSEMBLY_ACC=CAM_ASM_000672 /TAXON_ID=267983 /ORGANISM="Skeletonema japonicum, Strain CCMP2506" /LENGTH=323 /DNA_ID=CAMNT_0048212641 /DNA_START=57 /DNA_END=1028 /DNA_ORIENTATION=-
MVSVSIFKNNNSNSSSKMCKVKPTSKSKLLASIGGTVSGSELSKATEPPSSIASLIANREWSLLDGLLMDSAPLSIDDADMGKHAITENVVLHFALRFQAPLRTVSLLSKVYPSSITSPDASGRYPIHVACKWSATPNVVNYLVRLNSSACGVQDSFGKTPMHYVAEYYVTNYQLPLEMLYPMDENMVQVVKMLKSAAPTSVNLEDDEGCNAIEYALVNDVNMKVIKTMQRACRDDWRQRSKASDDGLRRRHSDLMKDLEELAMSLQKEMQHDDGGCCDNKESGFVHSAPKSSMRRGSMVKVISIGRVDRESQNPATATARSA